MWGIAGRLNSSKAGGSIIARRHASRGSTATWLSVVISDRYDSEDFIQQSPERYYQHRRRMLDPFLLIYQPGQHAWQMPV